MRHPIAVRSILAAAVLGVLVTVLSVTGYGRVATGAALVGIIAIAMYVAYQDGRRQRRAAMQRGDR
jgi:membrane associated rhomboid family serine protease